MRGGPALQQRGGLADAGAGARATVSHLGLEARIGGYEAAERSRDAIERVYGASAALIGSGPDEIAVVENATRAWDMAFYSVPLGPGDRILTAMAEYASNYIAYLQVVVLAYPPASCSR